MKLPRFLAGMAVGASVTGFLAAMALLYAMTAKFLVPSAEGVRLADEDEAMELAKRLIDDEYIGDEDPEGGMVDEEEENL